MALLVAVPVLVGSLGRIVVGALTDRYGGRVMFPLISAATIVPVLFIAFVALDSYTLLLVGGFFLGIAGTAFAVGVPFVNAWFPPERRGLAIGIFGAGMGGTAISALTTVKLYTNVGEQGAVPDHRRASSPSTPWSPGWCCGTPPAASCPRPAWPAGSSANARLPITWQACILYAVAFGGYVAFSVYLPAYLKTAHGLDAGGRGQPDGRLRRRRGDHASRRRLALGPVRPDPRAGRRVRRRRRSAPRSRPGPRRSTAVGTVAFLAMAAALGSGSGATFALDRAGHRPGPRGWRHRPGRRRRRARRLRAAADHGLRLRPHRLLRHRPVAAVGHRRADARADPDRRPPYRRTAGGTTA